MTTRRAAPPSRRERRRTPPTPSGGGPGWVLPLVSVAAIAAALAVIVLLTGGGPSGGAGRSPAAGASVAVIAPPTAIADDLADGATLGRATAPVTIEVWSDYQCPYCGQLARSYLPRLVDDFVKSGTVRIVAQDIAFLDRGTSTESTDAAVAAACAADQGRFWRFHDVLMWNQAGENAGAFAVPRLQAMASTAGLDVPAWNACRAGQAAARTIEGRTARAGTLGIAQTPTLIINGQAIVGLPASYDQLAAAIRQAAVPAASTAP